MTDSALSHVKSRLPTEVCEHVIEAAYDERYDLIQTSLVTLSSCSLVCRAWRPRAQSMLFEYVLLRDKDALYRYASLVEVSPKVGTYMRTLSLRGYLHVPFSPAVLFPTVLRGKLPNLEDVYFHELSEGAKAAKPLRKGEKELPSLPIHPFLPSLLSSISHIRRLYLSNVKFPSFGDIARILNTFPVLQELYCEGVSWAVLGQEPSCMVKREFYDTRKARNTFLPKLKLLACVDIDELGRQRLLSALGPSLRTLWMKFPNDPPSRRAQQSAVEPKDPLLVVDLQSVPRLNRLDFWLAPFPQPHNRTLDSLRDTLVSWVSASGDDRGNNVSSSQRHLYLGAWYRQGFKRDGFLELLRAIGPLVEATLCRQEVSEGDRADGTGGNTVSPRPETDPCRATVVVHALGDRLEWEDWWRAGIAECLPMFAKWKRLAIHAVHAIHRSSSVSLYPPEYQQLGNSRMHSLEHSKPKCGPGRTSTLPGEVTDNIIDHLHDDTTTLQEAALVSQSWLSSSQYHLFSITCCQLLAPGRGLSEFVAWLSSAQYATAHIAHLIIEGNFAERTGRPELCVQDVEIALERLPSLAALTIRGVTLTSGVPAGGLYRPLTRNTFTLLKFWRVATVDNTFHPVLHLLSLFSEVQFLHVNDLECVWDSDLAAISSLGLAPPVQHALRVESLTLCSSLLDGRWSGYRGIVHLFHHTQPMWQLRELAPIIPGVRLEETLGDFLPECEEMLTSLHIMACLHISTNAITPDDPQTTQPVPSLRHCRLLETLNLYFFSPPFVSDGERLESGKQACDRALAMNAAIVLAAPPTLRTVEIMFTYFDKYDSVTTRLIEGLSHWNNLDEAICRLEHAELVCQMAGDLRAAINGPTRRVYEMEYRAAGKDSDERVSLLRRMLPRTQASGRMKFVFVV
ncbi:hypothetical protein C8T65DRAFT_829212 [Cerioporus squamosus]|nr:hypothetical protein C8T65DRAFT_829212 [Cerioporus squamosus]